MQCLSPIARLVLTLSFALSLAACFVNHAEPIGAPEPAEKGQWSGGWVAEPLQVGGEPGYFAIADVDPAKGHFSVSEADGDGNAMSEPMEMQLRRVGETLFLDVRNDADAPWMLFVVAEATPERVVLAWKPRADAFRAAIAGGTLAGTLKMDDAAVLQEVALADFTLERQQKFARDWQRLFTDERIVLRRMRAE